MFLFKDGSVMIIVILTYFKLNCADATTSCYAINTQDGQTTQYGPYPLPPGQHGPNAVPIAQRPPICCPPQEKAPIKEKFKRALRAMFKPSKTEKKKKKKGESSSSDVVIISHDSHHHHHHHGGSRKGKAEEEEEESPDFSEDFAAAAGAVIGAGVGNLFIDDSGTYRSTSEITEAPNTAIAFQGSSLTIADEDGQASCSCVCLDCKDASETLENIKDFLKPPDMTCPCTSECCKNVLCFFCSLGGDQGFCID